MQTISLIAQKGGTGKTTLALSLAAAADRQGLSVVIIDLDPQATACNWSDRRESESPIVIDAQPGRLPKTLEKAEQGGVDIVIIDTPARSANASLAAAKVADLVLIPCRPQIYDLETIPHIKDLLALAGDKPVLSVLNAVPPRGSRHSQATAALKNFGIPVCPVTIGHRAAFGDAGTLGKTVLEYEPNGKAATEILEVFKYINSFITFKRSGEKTNVREQSRLEPSLS